MKRLFLDANILLAFHFNNAEKWQQKAIDFIFSEIEKQRWEGYISLITFYRLLYFIDKKINNPKAAAQRAFAYLSVLQLTPFDPETLAQQKVELWPDYEDGLQHACARSGLCEVLITTNSVDFFASELPVIDPLNFALQFGL
jgi:predicted nucleic acid-binding protein